jgi:fructose/tagatose bisphosphate aldolase
MGIDAKGFQRALEIGRPPNVRKLFPNSKALIVSGKVVDRALLIKGQAMTIAANARNRLIIHGALRAAERARAAIIIEIAKSEGGASAYCPVNYWNMATYVDAAMNELGITVPVAVHADHYGIKGPKDVEAARTEIPSMFEAGLTSIAIDASHLPDDENLLAAMELGAYIPAWAGLETEVGEIKGKQGLSTPEEALFLVRGLNAHGIFPDWIALNNGTSHGIEASEAGIQVELTAGIHKALEPYRLSGAQHGTSGNSSERLRRIAKETATTKANVATALQMISWGVKVNDYGNAELDAEKRLVKVPGAGVSEEVWAEMVAYGTEKQWKAGDYKSINLPFDNRIMRQPAAIRERSVKAVEDFVHNMLVSVFNAEGSADLAVEAILKAGSFDLGPKAERIEKAEDWTPEQIHARAKTIGSDKGPAGNFDD